MIPEPPDRQDHERWVVLTAQYLPWHIKIYAGVVVLMFLLYYISPAERGLFIPVLLWGVAVLAHYLTVRAIYTDPDWVEQRSEMITMNASDLSHIEDIRERHDKRMAEKKSEDPGSTGNSQKGT